METIWQDTRYGIRMLLRSPGVTAAAVLALALGIGANTAIFSLLDAVVFRPLPVPEPERLAQLWVPTRGGLDNSFNYPLYADYRDGNTVFEGLTGFDGMALNLTVEGQSERLSGMIVSGNYFDVLRVRMALGRGFLPEEDRTPLTHAVVVVSHGLWQRRFGGDPSLVGRTILLNGREFTVVGITPREFTGTMRGFAPELYVPMQMYGAANPAQGGERLKMRAFTWMMIMGRLKAGVALAQAQAAMRALATHIRETQPMNTHVELVLTDASRGYTGLIENLSKPLRLLQVVVGLVLLITCANVANLLLARSVARRRETAIRLALGAGRGRLVRQFLTESLLLSVAGGAAGLVLAPWIGEMLLRFRPTPTFFLDFALDWRVLLFAFGVTLVSGVLFGLVPAWQSARADLVPALKQDLGSSLGSGRGRLRTGLVVVQLALSLAVLVAAGLCLRSLRGLRGIDAGFDPGKVLAMAVDLGRSGYNEPRGRQFQRDLLDRVGALSGVECAALAQIVPLSGSGMRITSQPEGHVSTQEEPINLSFNVVTPGFFRTMGILFLRGRDFTERDAAGAPLVAIVSEALARQYWPGQEPLGKHIELSPLPGQSPQVLEVIGVVRDSKYRSLTEPMIATMFLPMAQNYDSRVFLFLRGADARALVEPVRGIVRTLDANLPVFNIRTLEEQRTSSLYTSRLVATLLSLLGALALLLAAFGLYAVVAFSVAQRTREIGVRMALGAGRWEILQLVVSQGMIPVAIGVGLGLAAAAASTRLLRTLLYGVEPYDLATFAGVAILLAGVALAACAIPARRAANVDPMVALRYE